MTDPDRERVAQRRRKRRDIWLQSDIARWTWFPSYKEIPGAVFPDQRKYRPSYANFHWGRWVLAWEVILFEYDSLLEGSEVVVNTHPCVVRHWNLPRLFSRKRRS
jgi:hypothetical protein